MFLDDFAVLILYIDKGCVVVPRHFEFYFLKCKNFSIDFLNELGNFKQKNFYTSKCKFFLHFTATDPKILHFSCS